MRFVIARAYEEDGKIRREMVIGLEMMTTATMMMMMMMLIATMAVTSFQDIFATSVYRAVLSLIIIYNGIANKHT